MASRKSFSLFDSVNQMFLAVLAVSCILPFVYLISVSFSSGNAVVSGQVTFWPVEFTWDSYEYVANRPAFWSGLLVSLKRLALGVSLSMLLIILTAFPLSKESSAFRARTPLVWYFVFTMLFSGGLIPGYLLVRSLHLLDTIWALVLPGAVPVFSVVLLLNFLRNLPKEIADSAAIDGAGEWQMLWRIYVPLSKPALATLVLFSVVGHWNSWFDGMIYNNMSANYPLQTYLSSLVSNIGNSVAFGNIDEVIVRTVNFKTVLAAQIFLAALPMIMIYPFLQKYFTKGIVMGSIKE